MQYLRSSSPLFLQVFCYIGGTAICSLEPQFLNCNVHRLGTNSASTYPCVISPPC